MSYKIFSVFLLCFCIHFINCIHNKYCQLQCDYVIKIFPHTVCDRQEEKCGPHKRCGPNFQTVAFSDPERQYILDLHNWYRNKIATGNENRGNQPPAANMNTLSYSKELEAIAQCWANTCNGSPLIHDHCRRTSQFEHVGQNLGFINTSLPQINVVKSLEELITLWYEEVTLFDNQWVNDTQDRGPNYKVGHFTQMIWADTLEVGCAATLYTKESQGTTWNNMVFVCNYGPGGNYLGLPVYEIGQPLSKCTGALKADFKFPGLCGNEKKLESHENSIDFFEFV